jgi:hypothetical protein
VLGRAVDFAVIPAGSIGAVKVAVGQPRFTVFTLRVARLGHNLGAARSPRWLLAGA